MTEPSFSQLLDNLSPKGEGSCSVTITDNWMQGRTTYGGLSAALCLKATQLNYPDLPPLRSAQINFIGPAGGPVIIHTKVLRQGRAVSYISAEMVGEKGLATNAVFCFGASRESKLDRDFTNAPDVPQVSESTNFFDSDFGPAFSRNYDCLLAKGGHPISGSDHSEHFIWARHKDPKASDLASLIGVADMPPPAVLPMFEEFAPISSNEFSKKRHQHHRWLVANALSRRTCQRRILKPGYASMEPRWRVDRYRSPKCGCFLLDRSPRPAIVSIVYRKSKPHPL